MASHARRSTWSPSGTMSPVSSAIAMSRSAGTIPLPARCQRTSASNDTGVSVGRSTSGCKWMSMVPSRSATLSSCSSLSRSTAAACMAGSNARARLPPSFLATYSAASASLSPSSTVVEGSTTVATPMLAVTVSARPCRSSGCSRASISCCAVAIGSTSVGSGRTMTNSSPPTLPTVPRLPRSWAHRRATATMTRSPTSWPRLSLTTLSRSRSA